MAEGQQDVGGGIKSKRWRERERRRRNKCSHIQRNAGTKRNNNYKRNSERQMDF